MKPTRIFFTALLGMLFFLFVAFDLVVFGVVPLNSVVVSVLPALGLVIGGVLGAMVSKRKTALAMPTAPATSAMPAAPAAPETSAVQDISTPPPPPPAPSPPPSSPPPPS